MTRLAAALAVLLLVIAKPSLAEDARLDGLLQELRVWQSRGRELEAMVLQLRQADVSDRADGDASSQPPAEALLGGVGPQALAWRSVDEPAAAAEGEHRSRADGGGAFPERHAALAAADARLLEEDVRQHFHERKCTADTVGNMLCDTEKGMHWMIKTFLVFNPTLIVAATLLTFVNFFGYYILWVHENVLPAKGFLSAVVVLNVFHEEWVTFSPALLSYAFIIFQVVLAEWSKWLNRVQLAEWVEKKRIFSQSIDEEESFSVVRAAQADVARLSEPGSPGDLVVTSRYREITMPLSRIMMYFFAQGTLMLFYTYEVMLPEVTDTQIDMSCLRWILAVVLCYIAGEDELGGRYGGGYFDLIISVAEGKVKDADLKGFNGQLHSHHVYSWCKMSLVTEWRIRKYLALIVNGGFRALILGTAPVLLATSGPLSFIKDCLALFFITRLDDIDDAKSLRHELLHVLHDQKVWQSRTQGRRAGGEDRASLVDGTGD